MLRIAKPFDTSGKTVAKRDNRIIRNFALGPSRELRTTSHQMRSEEGQGGGVELLVKGGAVEPRSVGADVGTLLRQIRRAGRKECVVTGIRHEMIVGSDRQVALNQ